MKIKKRSGDKVSPCMVPLSILIGTVEFDLGDGISVQFCYHFDSILWKSKVMHDTQQFVMVYGVEC